MSPFFQTPTLILDESHHEVLLPIDTAKEPT